MIHFPARNVLSGCDFELQGVSFVQSNLGLTDKCGPTTVRCWKKSVKRKRSVFITALKLNEQNKLNKLTDTSCDVTMQVNGESLCLCDNVARFLVSSAIDFRL